MQALALCTEVHMDDLDRNGMPYVLHPIRVMEKQETMDRKIIALLHDAVEMHPEKISFSEIRLRFGPSIEHSVRALTRNTEESWDDYVDRIIQDEDAAIVKIADLEDNMNPRRMDARAAEKTGAVYIHAYRKICKTYGIIPYLRTRR